MMSGLRGSLWWSQGSLYFTKEILMVLERNLITAEPDYEVSRPSHPLRCLILLISSVMMAMATPRAAAVDTVDPSLNFLRRPVL